MWTRWCSGQQINPLSAPLEAIVNFPAGQFDSGMEYRTLNVYHSAISATHPVLCLYIVLIKLQGLVVQSWISSNP